MFRKLAFLCFICSTCLSFTAHAKTEHYAESWNNAVITGPLSTDKSVRYFLQPGLDFVDSPYKFGNSFLFAGVGKVLNPDMLIWTLNGYFFSRSPDGKYSQRDTLREQFDWIVYRRAGGGQLTSTSRLEIRKDLSESPLAVRVRQRFWLRLPFPSWPDHTFSMFDEIFFNINNPRWIGTKSFFDENRFFVGVGTQLSEVFSFDIGYLNQFLDRTTPKVNNVLFIRIFATFP